MVIEPWGKELYLRQELATITDDETGTTMSIEEAIPPTTLLFRLKDKTGARIGQYRVSLWSIAVEVMEHHAKQANLPGGA